MEPVVPPDRFARFRPRIPPSHGGKLLVFLVVLSVMALIGWGIWKAISGDDNGDPTCSDNKDEKTCTANDCSWADKACKDKACTEYIEQSNCHF